MPEREERPGRQTEALTDPTPIKSSVSSLPSPTPETRARRRWAYGLIRRASSPVPSYGSAEWAKLADGHPDRVAGCVVAAEAWAQDAENLIDDLRREIDVRREVAKRQEDQDYQDRAAAHRAEWSRRTSTGMSFSQRRAKQMESIKPRSGDYEGRRA